VTDADVEKYRKERGEEGEALERYRLSQLFFPVDPKADAKTWETVKQRAFDARMTAQKAGDFLQAATEIAQRYNNEGAEAAPLGNVTAKELQSEIAAAVGKLEVGRISEPVRTSKGIHLLYLEHKSSARELLFAERYEQERAKWAKQLRTASAIQIVDRILAQ
jgi:parvulin-like peptidyl-prolyl isomerase